jgi:hypothetical protein
LQVGYNERLDTLQVWLEQRWARAGLSVSYHAPDKQAPLWDDTGELTT